MYKSFFYMENDLNLLKNDGIYEYDLKAIILYNISCRDGEKIGTILL